MTVTVDGEPINYSGLPDHQHAFRMWIEHGVCPGTGIYAILRHDLMAICICDDETVRQLPQIMRWLHNHAPSACHGSTEKVTAWKKAHE